MSRVSGASRDATWRGCSPPSLSVSAPIPACSRPRASSPIPSSSAGSVTRSTASTGSVPLGCSGPGRRSGRDVRWSCSWILLGVGAGCGEGFLGQQPAIHDLAVGALLDQGVEGGGVGLGESAAGGEGAGDQGLVGPAGVDPPLQLEVLAAGGDERQGGE